MIDEEKLKQVEDMIKSLITTIEERTLKYQEWMQDKRNLRKTKPYKKALKSKEELNKIQKKEKELEKLIIKARKKIK